MCAQVEVKAEAFIADITFIGFFASVNQLVPFELTVIKELLAASLNHAPEHSFSVRHFVFSVSGVVRKNF